MMDSLKKGDYDCILVKDLSRFGRNWIESGRYIEQIFPYIGVRFIAVTDNYDSMIAKNSGDNISLPFKNLINDAYAADISVKIRSHLASKRKNGDFIGAFATFGYEKCKENHEFISNRSPLAYTSVAVYYNGKTHVDCMISKSKVAKLPPEIIEKICNEPATLKAAGWRTAGAIEPFIKYKNKQHQLNVEGISPKLLQKMLRKVGFPK